MDDWIGLLVALLGGVGAAIVTTAAVRRRTGAETESLSVQSLALAVKHAREEADRARNEADRAHHDRNAAEAALNAARIMLEECKQQRLHAEGRIDALEHFLRLNYQVNPEDINGHPI